MKWFLSLILMIAFSSPLRAEEDEIVYRVDTRIDSTCTIHYQIRHLERDSAVDLSLSPKELEAAILWTNTFASSLGASEVLVEYWEEIGSISRGAFEGALYAGVMSRFALDRPRHLRRWFYFISVTLGASYRYVERELLRGGEDSRGHRFANELMRRFRPVTESIPDVLRETELQLRRNRDEARVGACSETELPTRLAGLDYVNGLRLAIHFGKERGGDSR
jgi:hypothetical protein